MAIERWRPRTGLMPWRPFWEPEDLPSRFESLWSPGRFPFEMREWMPPMDMYEKDGSYIVKAEIPGMKEEDVDVSVSGNKLTVRGEKKAETEINEEDYYRCERSYGSFFRSIDLPPDADSSKIEANYEDGILEVMIPKTEATKSKKVKVTARKKEKIAK